MLHVGDVTSLSEVFRDDAGDPVDPSGLVVTVTGSAGATTYTYGVSAQLTRVEAGVFALAAPVAVTGGHQYQWVASGGGVVDRVRSGEFWVSPLPSDALPSGVTPSVREVADLLNQRDVDAGGKPLGTFTDATEPSALDAQRAIEKAQRIVLALIGDLGSTASHVALCRDVIAHRAAMTLTRYLPSPEPEYERLKMDFDMALDALRGLVTNTDALSAGWASVPVTTRTAQDAATI